ncbi:hypothetical protein [Streptacidiphilus jiangxiensis]|uniref:Uncharacterized protein n=1 Tax=Streptacidiphilus jiangxiensis TaxID=235985 RepID=A0A1H7FKC8_STRJI|nr:hypothetical protein [Streptacidiphilus jiangxiensis]SEK26449.1 hypothetical protein SAMN05414137_101298 [Streptacidiphilus jiangxiensis]
MTPTLDRPRVVLLTGVGAALLLVLALGTDVVWLRMTQDVPLVPRTEALGVPPLLPGLRPNPRGDTTWAFTWAEDFAALLLLGTVAGLLRRHVLRHPYAGAGRRLRAGWAAVVAGGTLAGVFRGMALARMTGAAPLGWTVHPLAGAVSGACWGVALGWTVGLAVALVGVRRTSVRLEAPHGEHHRAPGMGRR